MYRVLSTSEAMCASPCFLPDAPIIGPYKVGPIEKKYKWVNKNIYDTLYNTLEQEIISLHKKYTFSLALRAMSYFTIC